MTTHDLHAAVTDRRGDPVIELVGELNAAAAVDLDAAYDRAVETDPAAVVLDFTRTEYMNSTGIALIVSLLGKARSLGIDVRARGLSDHYREIFEVTRLSDFITILDGSSAQPGADRSSHA